VNHNNEVYPLLQEIELLEIKLSAAKERLTSHQNAFTIYRTLLHRLWLTIFVIGMILLALIIVVDLQSHLFSPDAYFLLNAVAGVLAIVFVVLTVWQIEQTNKDRRINILRDPSLQKREIARFRVKQGLDELLIAKRSLEGLSQK